MTAMSTEKTIYTIAIALIVNDATFFISNIPYNLGNRNEEIGDRVRYESVNESAGVSPVKEG